MRAAVSKLPGVDSVRVSLNQGVAWVWFASDSRTTVAHVRRAIRDNGFSPKDAEARLTGVVDQQGGHSALVVPGWSVAVWLDAPPGDSALVADLVDATGKRVSVEGRVPESDAERGEQARVEVRAFRVLR